MGAAAILTGVSSLVGAYSAKSSADAQAAATIHNAQLQQKRYEAQAQLAERQAADTTAQAEAQSRADADQEREIRRKAEAVQSQQRAAQGASGLDANSGSALQLQVDTEEQGEKDAATFNLNSARKKFQSLNAAQTYRYQAALDRAAGTNTMNAAYATASAQKSAGTSAALGSLVNQNWYKIFPSK